MTTFYPLTADDPRKQPEGYCGTCGALIRWSETGLHSSWHTSLLPADDVLDDVRVPEDGYAAYSRALSVRAMELGWWAVQPGGPRSPWEEAVAGASGAVPDQNRVLLEHPAWAAEQRRFHGVEDTSPEAVAPPAYTAQGTDDWGPRVEGDWPGPETADRIRRAYQETVQGIDRGDFSQHLEEGDSV